MNHPDVLKISPYLSQEFTNVCDARASIMDVVQDTTLVVLVMVTVITILNVNQVLFVETTIVRGEMVMIVVWGRRNPKVSVNSPFFYTAYSFTVHAFL